MIDEVHLLGEPGRGSSLEAGVVSRLKMVSRFPDMADVSLVSISVNACHLHGSWAD